MFNIYHQPYARGRYPVVAANGIVATGNNLAAAAGLQIMREGGNAIDAAIATAAALTVVEPTANGIGSDAFAIVFWDCPRSCSRCGDPNFSEETRTCNKRNYLCCHG